MLKRLWMLGFLMICLPLVAMAQNVAEPAPEMIWASLAGTGYRIGVPTDWAVTTQPDVHKAVMTAVSEHGTQSILAFVSAKEGLTLDQWKKALQKSSQHNSVSHIGEQTTGECAS